jgi:hypothetical protein
MHSLLHPLRFFCSLPEFCGLVVEDASGMHETSASIRGSCTELASTTLRTASMTADASMSLHIHGDRCGDAVCGDVSVALILPDVFKEHER